MNILIVDDMEIFRRQIKRLKIWKDERFNLKYEASDGKEALDLLKSEDVDLVIADIKMPVINGIELLKEISDLKLPVKVVFLSEHSDFEFARTAIQYGAFDYLLKPVILEDLTRTLEKVYEEIESSGDKKGKLYSEDIDNIGDALLGEDELLNSNLENLKYKMDRNVKMDDMENVLSLVYLDILNEFIKKNPWIENFIDMRAMKNIIFDKKEGFNLFKGQILFIKKKINRIYAFADNLRVKSVVEYILNNIDDIRDINDIAEKFYLSKTHLSYIFKEELNITLGTYISNIKVERGKKLIYDGLKNFEISERLGYSSSEYFEKLFKKTTGYTPTEFRNRGDFNE